MQSFLCYAVLSLCVELFFATSQRDENRTADEFEKHQERLSRETSPLGRVKILIKMSDLTIGEVNHWVKKGNLLEADRFLKRYVEVIKETHKTLKSSNRNAQRNPAGFKDFEISLRRQLRKLADLKLNYSFDQQEAINEAIAAAESAKEEMLREIFGSENAGPRKEHSPSAAKTKEESP
jgi:hypothetical protein